jgi:hypothetical protein
MNSSYTHNTTVTSETKIVVDSGHQLQEIKTNHGVYQGRSFSPTLFKWDNSVQPGIQLNRKYTDSMSFAANQVILRKSDMDIKGPSSIQINYTIIIHKYHSTTMAFYGIHPEKIKVMITDFIPKLT